MPEEISTTVEVPSRPVGDRSVDWIKVTLAVVVGLIFLVSAAYAGYWYGTQEISKLKDQISKLQLERSFPSGVQNQEELTLPQWKIYRDKESRFSFKYPSYLDDSDLIDYQYFDIIKFTGSYPDVDLIIKVINKDLSKIDIRPTSPHTELAEDVVRLGQLDFVKVSYYRIIEGVPHTVKSYDYFISSKDLTVSFSLVPSLEANRKPAAYKDVVDITEQILSTFKFLD